MADYSKDDLDKTGAGNAKIHKIRITLTSRNVKPLEKCGSFLSGEERG
jgi:small subunit ribosomal protein S20e